MSTTTNEILTSIISNADSQSNISYDYIESVIGTPRTIAGQSPSAVPTYDNYIYQDSTGIIKSDSATQLFNTVYEARNYLDTWVKNHYKTTVTIPDVNGIDYAINIINIIAYNLSSSSVLIEFNNAEILEIICVNSTHATKHYEYLNKVYTGYTIYDSFTGTRHEVNPGESIQQAVQNASPGDLIVVNTGSYTESISLKNGVDIYFAENCILTANAGFGLFNDILGYSICNIYGFPDITVNNCLILGLYKDNSDVYLEINEADQYATTVGCFYQYCNTAYQSTIRVKGYFLNKHTGDYLGISDFDGYGNIFVDFDFIKIISAESNFIYGFSHNTGNIFISRNMYCSTGAYVTIESSNYYNPSIITLIFINSRFKNANAINGSIFLQFDPTTDDWQGQHKAYFHNCYMRQTGKCIDATYSITAYMYGNNISKTDKDNQVTLAGTGTLTVDSNLTISET